MFIKLALALVTFAWVAKSCMLNAIRDLTASPTAWLTANPVTPVVASECCVYRRVTPEGGVGNFRSQYQS